MKFNDLLETDIAEPEDFLWYKKPTQEQIKKVAKETNKVHFVAFKNKDIIVFPADIEFREFSRAIGGGTVIEVYSSLYGTAQNAGVGWIISRINNIEQLKQSGDFSLDDWQWIEKYFILGPYNKNVGKTRIASKKEISQFSNTARDRFANLNDRQAKAKKFKPTNLKNFVDKYGNQHSKN
jgi:hypothetical protein